MTAMQLLNLCLLCWSAEILPVICYPRSGMLCESTSEICERNELEVGMDLKCFVTFRYWINLHLLEYLELIFNIPARALYEMLC